MTPEVEARAIPRHDRTAFVLARFTNTSGEILLPGQAFLIREGTLVGATWIATRYDRCPKVFLSAVALAATVMFWL